MNYNDKPGDSRNDNTYEDPFVKFAKNDNSGSTTAQVDIHSIIEKLCETPGLVGPYIASFLAWNTDRNNDMKTKLATATRVMNNMLVKSKYAKMDNLKNASKYIKYLNDSGTSESNDAFARLIVDDLGQVDLAIIANAVNCAIYTASLESSHRVIETAKNLRKKDAIVNMPQNPDDRIASIDYMSRFIKETSELCVKYIGDNGDYKQFDPAGTEYFSKILDDCRTSDDGLHNIFFTAVYVMQAMLTGDMMSRDWTSDGSKILHTIISFCNFLQLYCILVTRSITGKEGYIEAMNIAAKKINEIPASSNTKESDFNPFDDTNIESLKAVIKKNGDVLQAMPAKSLELYVIAMAVYNSVAIWYISPVLETITDTDKGKYAVIDKNISTTVLVFKLLAKAVTESLPDTELESVYNGTILAVSSGTHFRRGSWWANGLDTDDILNRVCLTGGIYTERYMKNFISNLIALKNKPEYSDYAKFIHTLSYKSSSYISFLSFYIETKKYEKIVSLIYDHELVATNNKHAMAIIDSSEYGLLCILVGSESLIRMTNAYCPVCRFISDIIVHMLANAKIKDLSKDPDMKFLPLYGIAMYTSAVAAGIYDLISAKNNTYNWGFELLINILNAGLSFQYRCQRLPINRYRKDGRYTTVTHYGTWYDMEEQCHKDLIEVHERVNSSAEAKIQGPIDQLKNIIGYLGDALVNGTINAEYAVLLLLKCYNADILKNMGLVFPQGHEKINVWKMMIDYIFSIEGYDGNKLYDFFRKPITNTFQIMSKKEATDGEVEKSNDEDYINLFTQHLEVIVFITILQRITNTRTYNKILDLKVSPYSPKLIENPGGYASSTASFSDVFCYGNGTGNIDTTRVLSGQTELSTSMERILDDMETALNKIDSVVIETPNLGDWFDMNRDRIIPDGGGTSPEKPEEPSQYGAIPRCESVDIYRDDEELNAIEEPVYDDTDDDSMTMESGGTGSFVVFGVFFTVFLAYVAFWFFKIGINWFKDRAAAKKLRPILVDIENELKNKHAAFMKAFNHINESDFLNRLNTLEGKIVKFKKLKFFFEKDLKPLQESEFIRKAVRTISNYYRNNYTKESSIRSPVSIKHAIYTGSRTDRGVGSPFDLVNKFITTECAGMTKEIARYSKDLSVVYSTHVNDDFMYYHIELEIGGRLSPKLESQVIDLINNK